MRILVFFFILHFSFFLSPCFADEDFGDITADASAIYTGNTYHGYAEVRVSLLNRSHEKTHTVTLVLPDHSYGGGNVISRLERSVTLAPEASVVLSLLQPPLPMQGDRQMRVTVDGRDDGTLTAPNAGNHCNDFSYSGSTGKATVFIDRNLDFDAVAKLFQSGGASGSDAFTAMQATGPPDARMGGYQPNAWMPDNSRPAVTNWLELDYAAPENVDKIEVYVSQPLMLSGQITLKGTSGTNLVTIPMSSGRFSTSVMTTPAAHGHARLRLPRMIMTFSFPPTSEPVKTLRLDFGMMLPSQIGIDAVSMSGTGGRFFASTARASSDNSAAAPSGSSPADLANPLRAESAVSDWSENWLAYTPFDAVVIKAADVGVMSPAIFDALGNYLLAGGNVVISGKMDLPAAWHPLAAKELPDGNEYETGFGRCFIFPSENISGWDEVSVQRLRQVARDSAQYWRSLPDDNNSANQLFPVVNNLKIPTRGIVLIMLAFVIIIGPVNIIWLSRRKRRTWMLWTIPAISFATTLIVFAYSLLREGITPDTRIAGLTYLDQINHRTATLGVTAFYCPLTPGGGLTFDYTTEATPLVSAGYGSGTSRDVDWTQSQHFQHGWVSARVPAHFHLRKAETHRERLQMQTENGQLQILNGLGTPVKSLWLADATGKIFRAENIAAGQKGELSAAAGSVISEKLGANGLNHDLGFTVQSADGLTNSAAKYLLPGTYIAVLDNNPFIENALGSAASAKRTRTAGVVFGVLDSGDEK